MDDRPICIKILFSNIKKIVANIGDRFNFVTCDFYKYEMWSLFWIATSNFRRPSLQVCIVQSPFGRSLMLKEALVCRLSFQSLFWKVIYI